MRPVTTDGAAPFPSCRTAGTSGSEAQLRRSEKRSESRDEAGERGSNGVTGEGRSGYALATAMAAVVATRLTP